MPRRVLSFIGGIDLCDGRFDTHDHPLFRTLQLEHKQDFYQDCLPGVDGEAGGAWTHVDLLIALSALQRKRQDISLDCWALCSEVLGTQPKLSNSV